MSSLDSTNLISTPEASSDSASQIGYSLALSPWTFDVSLGDRDELITRANGANIRFVTPAIQTFEIGASGSMIYGYTIDDPGVRSGHFVQTLDSLDPQVVQAKIARMACHFMVDLTPASGLEEVLEKTMEIREYFCSLENWRRPALAAETSVAANPGVVSYERDPFTYSEE
jgi:hypothetical protein